MLLEDAYARQLVQSGGTENTDSFLEAGPVAPEPVDESSPLLEAGPTSEPDSKVGLLEFITKREYRLGFMIVVGVMLAQQLTGKLIQCTRVWRLVMRRTRVRVARGHICARRGNL